MATLSPLAAAQLADAVYGIRTVDNVTRGVAERMGGGVTRQLGADWDLDTGAVANGVSGAIATQRSGFGLVLRGRADGTHPGETAVLTRGTQTAYDWASNAAIGVTPGPLALGVHAGFNRIYQSIINQILPQLPDRGTIHVIGHSLGGALANLIAARLYSAGRRDLELYTFGAPRVGLPPFSLQLARGLGEGRIHRVYNVADPVPMVPIYPFAHSPLHQDGLRVGNSAGLVSIDAHLMTSYTPLARSNNDWTGLQRAALDVHNYRNLDELLALAGERISIPGASWALWALGKALQALVDLALTVVGGTLAAFATVVDVLAHAIVHAATLAQRMAGQVIRFIELVFKWAGKATVRGAQLTADFLAYAIRLVATPLTNLAYRSLTLVYR